MMGKNRRKKLQDRRLDKLSGRSGIRQRSGKQKRVNVDFPVWMIHRLDKEAKRLGVPRHSIIKIWIAERLKEISG